LVLNNDAAKIKLYWSYKKRVMKFILTMLCLSFTLIQCKKTSEAYVLKEEELVSNLYNCSNKGLNANYFICVDSLYDSRCPSNVICANAGISVIKIKFIIGDSIYPLKMCLNKIPTLALTNDTLINGYRIKYTNQLPYPNTNINTSAADKKSYFNVSF
jgi:hypothetical protein